MTDTSDDHQIRLPLSPMPAVLDGQLPLDPAALVKLALERAQLGANWLASVVQTNGAFPYFYYPDRDAYDHSTYNEVRHAGSVYSLFQTNEVLQSPTIRIAAEQAASYIVNSSLSVPFGGAAFLYKGKCKLGGQALALVALLERRRTTQQTDLDDIIIALATFLLNMELSDESGRYYQSYIASQHAPLLTPYSNYYPGEALLALARLAAQFPDGPWLEAANRAASFLIYRKDGDIMTAGRVPREDHWLTMALSELHQLDPNPAYAAVAFMQADAMIANQIPSTDTEPWRIGASFRPGAINFTSTATKAEAMNAAWKLSLTIGDQQAIDRFSAGALRTIQFLMRVQYTEQSTAGFPRPDHTIGAWGQDIQNSRIRLDFVQHSISALVGAYQLETQ